MGDVGPHEDPPKRPAPFSDGTWILIGILAVLITVGIWAYMIGVETYKHPFRGLEHDKKAHPGHTHEDLVMHRVLFYVGFIAWTGFLLFMGYWGLRKKA